MKRPVLACLVLACLLGTFGVAPGTSATAAITPTLSAFGTCSDPFLQYGGLECARLTVPLDYADASKGTISLAVSRRPSVPSAGAYQGIVLTNPGGPGGSGTWMPQIADALDGAGDTYDWIGFDPRGVGASTPALRCDGSYFHTSRPPYVPRTNTIMQVWLKRTRYYSAHCGGSSAKRLLPFLRTVDTVRDMESLRRALQARMETTRPSDAPKLERINYYGYSYGTYLGEVYATRHPTRVGRFVLDGVVNPTRVWYRANLDQDVWFDRNANSWFAYLAAHPGAFRLGTDWRVIRSGYYSMLRKLAHAPAAGGRLGPDELNDVLLGVGYSASTWPELGYEYSALVRRGAGGDLLQSYLAGADATDDNGYAVYSGVQCTDVAWPSFDQQRRNTWQLHYDHPFLSWNNTWYAGPCRNWPAPRGTRPYVSGASVTSRILLINETRDAATPYTGALEVRRRFPSARLIAGQGGTTHASSLSGVQCVDRRIEDYFRTGATPARRSTTGADVVCPRVPVPSPSMARTTTGGLAPSLRARLIAAQRP